MLAAIDRALHKDQMALRWLQAQFNPVAVDADKMWGRIQTINFDTKTSKTTVRDVLKAFFGEESMKEWIDLRSGLQSISLKIEQNGAPYGMRGVKSCSILTPEKGSSKINCIMSFQTYREGNVQKKIDSLQDLVNLLIQYYIRPGEKQAALQQRMTTLSTELAEKKKKQIAEKDEESRQRFEERLNTIEINVDSIFQDPSFTEWKNTPEASISTFQDNLNFKKWLGSVRTLVETRTILLAGRGLFKDALKDRFFKILDELPAYREMKSLRDEIKNSFSPMLETLTPWY